MGVSATIQNKGDAGNNFVFGEGGQDAFLYDARGFNTDVIFDFNAADDTFVFSTNVFANYAAVQAATTQFGAHTVINSGGDDIIVLMNVNAASLSAADFFFF